MATIFGDSYGGVQAAAQAATNADSQRQQEAFRLIAQLRQQKIENAKEERNFQVNQQRYFTDLANHQQSLDREKELTFTKLKADEANLALRKKTQDFAEQKFGEEMIFSKDQAKSNAQLYEQEQGKKEAESLYNQVFNMGAKVEPYDAEKLFGNKISPKQKEMLVAGTTKQFDDQQNDYDLANFVSKSLNKQRDLKDKIDSYDADVKNKVLKKADEINDQRIRLAQLNDQKAKTSKYRTPKGDLSSLANKLLTIDENGDYVPIVKKPKTFRDLYPEPVTDSGASLGKIREMDSEAPPADLGSYAAWMNPQNGAQSTGTGNPLVDAGLVDPQYPVTPQSAPASRPMWDLGIAPEPQQSSVDPRTALVMKLMDKGMSIEDARKAANRYLQAQEQSTWFATP